MSREDLVFSKASLVVVATLTVIGGWVMTGWLMSRTLANAEERIEVRATQAATAAAVSAATAAIGPVHDEVLRHVAADDERVRSIDNRVEKIERRVYGVTP